MWTWEGVTFIKVQFTLIIEWPPSDFSSFAFFFWTSHLHTSRITQVNLFTKDYPYLAFKHFLKLKKKNHMSPFISQHMPCAIPRFSTWETLLIHDIVFRPPLSFSIAVVLVKYNTVVAYFGCALGHSCLRSSWHLHPCPYSSLQATWCQWICCNCIYIDSKYFWIHLVCCAISWHIDDDIWVK